MQCDFYALIIIIIAIRRMRERDRGRNKEERKNNSALCTTWSLATLH